MAERKLHHYVPQFYLRRFATTTNLKCVGLYNLFNDVWVERAAIKHQACEEYLYGKEDTVEKALSKLEHLASIVFRGMVELGVPPPKDSWYYKVLTEFTLVQVSRTKRAGRDSDFATSSVMDYAFKHSEYYNDEKHRNVVFRRTYPSLETLLIASESLVLMEHLACKTIWNKTDLPLITSDHPAVKYNRFFEVRQPELSSLGLATKGLQIFLPISPRLLLLFYDPYVYKVSERKSNHVFISDKRDVNQLNALQYVSCSTQLYFGDAVPKAYLQELTKKYKAARDNAGPKMYAQEEFRFVDGEWSKLIGSRIVPPLINLDLSFVKLTKHAKQFAFDDRLVYLRHGSFEEWKRKSEKE